MNSIFMTIWPLKKESNFKQYFNQHCYVGLFYSQIRCIALRVLKTSKEFWVFLFRQSSSNLSGNACLLVIGAFWSNLFVSVCQARFVARDRPVSGNKRLVFFEVFFWAFPILVSYKNKAMSASCPRQKFHTSSRFPSLFLSIPPAPVSSLISPPKSS